MKLINTFSSENKMKTKEEMIALKKQFIAEYKDALDKVGNNLSVGIGADDKSGEPILAVRLTNKKMQSNRQWKNLYYHSRRPPFDSAHNHSRQPSHRQ